MDELAMTTLLQPRLWGGLDLRVCPRCGMMKKALTLSLTAAPLAGFPRWIISKTLSEQSFTQQGMAADLGPGLPRRMDAPQAVSR